MMNPLAMLALDEVEIPGVLLEDTPRDKLLKSIPDKICELITEFGETTSTDQDQLILTSLDCELSAAGLTWTDLANLLKHQIVAHRVASMRGRVTAMRNHRNKQRLTEAEKKFLADVHRRGLLLSDKQEAWLQSITDSLNESADDFALRQLARGQWEGRKR
jgi:hypothetical protein